MSCNNQMENVSTCNSLHKYFKGYNFISNLFARSKSKIVYFKSLDSQEIIKILRTMIAGQTSHYKFHKYVVIKLCYNKLCLGFSIFYLSEEDQIFDFLRKTFFCAFLATSIQSIQMVTWFMVIWSVIRSNAQLWLDWKRLRYRRNNSLK